jgi:hypothetical protein
MALIGRLPLRARLLLAGLAPLLLSPGHAVDLAELLDVCDCFDFPE